MPFFGAGSLLDCKEIPKFLRKPMAYYSIHLWPLPSPFLILFISFTPIYYVVCSLHFF
jgi:hypothetical protein